MKQRRLLIIFAAVLLTFLSTATFASTKQETSKEKDTDTRMIDARVVEVTDAHISVVARSGVEHVIAIDRTGTKVTVDAKEVSLTDLREGDVITIELDALNKMKFAKNISLTQERTEVARNRK
jgi:multidrug resistance efflux pump